MHAKKNTVGLLKQNNKRASLILFMAQNVKFMYAKAIFSSWLLFATAGCKFDRENIFISKNSQQAVDVSYDHIVSVCVASRRAS